MRYSRNWEQNTMLEKGRVCMKDREELLKEIALMLERQDMLSKLTENQCLDEYGYSETHCIDYIGRLELPNVTKVAEHMGMTRGAISKMTKKLLAKGRRIKRKYISSSRIRAGFCLMSMRSGISDGRSAIWNFWRAIPSRM